MGVWHSVLRSKVITLLKQAAESPYYDQQPETLNRDRKLQQNWRDWHNKQIFAVMQPEIMKMRSQDYVRLNGKCKGSQCFNMSLLHGIQFSFSACLI